MLKKIVERERIFEFLTRLNMVFNQVQVQVLGKRNFYPWMKSTPTFVLKKVEECDAQTIFYWRFCHGCYKGKQIQPDLVRETGHSDGSKNPNHEELWCIYCKKPRHTKEKYWKLHGKSQNQYWNGENKAWQQHSQANMTNCEGGPQEKSSFNSEEFGEGNKEKIEKLRNFLGILDKQSAMYSLAQTGKPSISHTLRTSDLSFTDSWVNDLRATKHMTQSSLCFSSNCPCLVTKIFLLSKVPFPWLLVNEKWISPNLLFYKVHYMYLNFWLN